MAIFIFIMLVAVIVFFDLYSRARVIRQKLSAFSQIIPGALLGGFLTKYSVKGETAGVKFTISATHGGNRSRPVLSAACEKKASFKVTIMRNDSQSDFFTRISHVPVMCSVVKTNDVYFDSRFSIYSHNNAEVCGYFYNTGRKNAVAKIIDSGYTLIRFNGKSVSALKYDYDREHDLQSEALKSILDNLIILTHGI